MKTIRQVRDCMRLGLAPQLVIRIMLVAVAAGGLVAVVLTNTSREALRNKILEDNLAHADLAAQLTLHYIMAAQAAVNTFATRPTVRNAVLAGQPQQVQDELASLLQNQTALDGAGLYDPQGMQRATGVASKQSVGSSFADRDWFQGAMATRKPYFGLPVLSRVTGHPVATYAVPILDEQGQVRGVIGASISLSTMSDAILDTDVTSGLLASLIDLRNGGIVIAHPDPTRLLTTPDPRNDEAIRHLLAGEHGALETFHSTGSSDLTSYSSVPGLPWGISITEPRETALASIDTLSRQAAVITFVSVLMAALLGGYWVLRVTRSIFRLRDAARQLTAGDLTSRVRFTQQDEIGELGRSFDHMADVLAEKETQLRTYAVRLEETIEGLENEVSERRIAEQALRASEDRYRRLFDDAVLGIFQTSLDGRVVAVNPAGAALFGYASPADLIAHVKDAGRDLFVDTQRRADMVRQMADRPEVQHFENVYRRKDGSTFVGLLHARLVKDGDGRPLHFEGLVEDITERKQAEENMRLFAQVIESTAEGIMITDAQANIQSVNQALVAISGYASEQIVGKDPSLFQSSEIAPRMFDELWHALCVTGRWQGEIKGRRQNGSGYPAWLTLSAVKSGLGEVNHYVGILSDISERKKAEQVLEQRNRELASLNRASQALNSTLDLDQVLIRCLDELQQMTGMAGAFWMVDSQSGDLICREASGLYGRLVHGMHLPAGQSIAGWTANHGESVIVQDVHADERFLRIVDPPPGMGVRSIVCMPLRSKDGVMGVLELLDGRVGAFAEGDLALVESLASTAAMAIQNAKLYEQANQLRVFNENIIQGMQEGVLLEDETGCITFVNPSVTNLLHYARDELIGQHWHAIVSPEHMAEADRESERRPYGIASRYELTLRTKEGAEIPILVSARPLFERGHYAGVLSVFTDITERKQAEEQMRALSLVDELTGLYNRRGFLTLAEQQMKTASRFQRRLLLLFSDLDRMKWINDNLGHPEGDRALIAVAAILKATFRESDIVARWGGDEFVVLAAETSDDSADMVTGRLLDHLAAANRPSQRGYQLSLSVGMARYDPVRPCSIDELLASADQSMYAQKRTRRSNSAPDNSV